MADEVKASGKNTTISVSAASRKALEDFKEARGYATVPEAFDAVVKILVEQEFNSAHPDHAAALDAMDELFAKVRKSVEGIIISSEESVAKVQAKADKDVSIYQEKLDDLAGRLSILDEVEEENKGLAKELEATQELLIQERELTARNRDRIVELEAERESVKAREAEAEAAIAAKAEAEKYQLAAEKVAEEAKAALAAVRAEAEKSAIQAAADLKAAQDESNAQKHLAASEVAHANDRASNAEGRANVLEGELARVRDERNASRSEVAALKAEVSGLERQIALMQDLLKPAPAQE
ncbi:hypothetical protein [Collinsella intestinalis]|uniref:hypothetical protein n=1 Tax=Collinsella intestinalis TaxID=147207 RepID=UPI002672A37E|nr:hypothetical protein [Collinsella intestinalis]